ncbi:PepSY domain-containing protein [Streptomyces sp. NPDC017993]|uniref:PepSY domain-containing protein n=1 Tax=Streptomyces sp. NPDC017993 TaxID=3365027 RepID=UPI0037A0BAD1
MCAKRTGAAGACRRPAAPRALGLACVIAAAGVLLAGCADEDSGVADGATKSSAAGTAPRSAAPSAPASRSAPASPSGGLTEDQAERKALVPAAKVNYEQALTAAIAAVPATEPVSAELEGAPGGGAVWETEVATVDGTAHTVRVDAATGKADPPRAEPDQDAEDKRELAGRLSRSTVTAQQAVQSATAGQKGTVSSIELGGFGNGTLSWAVDIVTPDWNRATYDIGATDRKILRKHVDRD